MISVKHIRSAESKGLRFDSSWGLRICLCPTVVTRRKTSSISLPSSKVTISLILFTNMVLSTLLIPAVWRTRVMWTSHRSAKSEGLRFDSSYYIWGILSHARHKTKNILPNFFNELKSYHLSYSIYESVKHVSLRTELTNYMPKICGGCHKRMKW